MKRKIVNVLGFEFLFVTMGNSMGWFFNYKGEDHGFYIENEEHIKDDDKFIFNTLLQNAEKSLKEIIKK